MAVVNRYLKNKAMDHIDHALGRPVDPMVETYRNYFATGANCRNAEAFRASPHWNEYRISDDMAGFEVTEAGRIALRDHLKAINDPWREYIVSYNGYEEHQTGKSHSNARYLKWLDVADVDPDLTFGEFCKKSRVRLARPQEPE
jgi:hypothetical protein